MLVLDIHPQSVSAYMFNTWTLSSGMVQELFFHHSGRTGRLSPDPPPNFLYYLSFSSFQMKFMEELSTVPEQIHRLCRNTIWGHIVEALAKGCCGSETGVLDLKGFFFKAKPLGSLNNCHVRSQKAKQSCYDELPAINVAESYWG